MQKTLIALACASASLAASADPVILKVAHFWPATALSQQKMPDLPLHAAGRHAPATDSAGD